MVLFGDLLGVGYAKEETEELQNPTHCLLPSRQMTSVRETSLSELLCQILVYVDNSQALARMQSN